MKDSPSISPFLPLVTVFPAYSLIRLTESGYFKQFLNTGTELLTGLVALSFSWFPASFSAIVTPSSSNLISRAECVGEVTQEGYINPDFRFKISSLSSLDISF